MFNRQNPEVLLMIYGQIFMETLIFFGAHELLMILLFLATLVIVLML